MFEFMGQKIMSVKDSQDAIHIEVALNIECNLCVHTRSPIKSGAFGYRRDALSLITATESSI
jgi:hypothetical protein